MARAKLTAYWPILLFAIPFIFFYFGLDSLFYRMEMRSAAVPIIATVESSETETYTCKDSDGNTRTCRRVAYDISFQMNGDTFQRPLLEGNFDPGDVWHSVDMIPPSDYPEGSEMEVLVRPDLDYRAAIDSFWSGYMLPMVLLGFGTFWFLGTLVIAPSILKDNLGLTKSRKKPKGGAS